MLLLRVACCVDNLENQGDEVILSKLQLHSLLIAMLCSEEFILLDRSTALVRCKQHPLKIIALCARLLLVVVCSVSWISRLQSATSPQGSCSLSATSTCTDFLCLAGAVVWILAYFTACGKHAVKLQISGYYLKFTSETGVVVRFSSTLC